MMTGGRRLIILRIYRSFWFLPTAYALGSAAVIALAPTFDGLVPYHAVILFKLPALEKILSILATSMLAVAIFSLGTMVSALEASASTATPRARVLISQDRTAQTAISTFIGAFIFSILGIIGLSTGYYGEEAAACVLMVAIAIIVAVIVVLISWIRRLSDIGGVSEVVRLVETATSSAFRDLAAEPFYGGVPCTEVPPGLHPVRLKTYGYIQHIEGDALGALSDRLGIDFYLVSRPGYLVASRIPVIFASAKIDRDVREEVRQCFVTGDRRTFEEDPQFGILVLSEIASKAVSPAINDPGTAIEVLNSIVRTIISWGRRDNDSQVKTRYPRLNVKPLRAEEVIVEAFRWIARDGASHLEIASKVQRALADVRAVDPSLFDGPAKKMSQEAFERAKTAMNSSRNVELLSDQRSLLALT